MSAPVNGLRAPKRTRAATEAVRRRRAEKLSLELAPRVVLLDDLWVQGLAFVVVSEIRRRGLQLPVDDPN